MPIYGVTQIGGVLTALGPGESMKLFDGTETPSAGVKSVAFNRAAGPILTPAGIVFTIVFGAANANSTVQIQGSNDDVDGHYQTLFVTTQGVQDSYYADAGNFCYYRAVLNTYSAGGQPVVIAQR